MGRGENSAMTKIAIVGGGWYGCHLAVALREVGCEVYLFEEREIFNGAATQNQLRLHLGYHYLRSQSTREQAKSGFSEFMQNYDFLTKEVESNFYAVPMDETLLDYGTICQILDYEGLPHSLVSENWNLWSSGFEAVFQTEERIIDAAKSKSHFLSKLRDAVVYRSISRTDFEGFFKEYDFVIDASYSSSFYDYPDRIFEATLICQFEQTWGQEIFQGLTLVDGELWSIYPTGQANNRTLSHVRHSPVFQSTKEDETRAFISSQQNQDFELEIEAIKEHVLRHVPALAPSLRNLEPRFLTKKVKNTRSSAKRVSSVLLEGNAFYVEAGKIDAIFQVERDIKSSLTDLGAI